MFESIFYTKTNMYMKVYKTAKPYFELVKLLSKQNE